MQRPLVSVVTPFYNAAPWLRECVGSVLAQTHERFEYILLDNASTDGSAEIALTFAAGDSRLRYHRNPDLLPQVANYNAALARISAESAYCKIVQADDWIFPECLRAMVEVFESSPSIGLVSAYYMKGSLVRGYGLPFSQAARPGADVVRGFLREGLFGFGSPTAHMYRSSIVRGRRPFFADGRYNEDTEACIEILRDWDFGFVHQVLSFLRTGNESITSSLKPVGPKWLGWYMTVEQYAPQFFDPPEAALLRRQVKDVYYGFLATCVLRARTGGLWAYHRRGLHAIGQDLEWPALAKHVLRKLGWGMANPGTAIAKALGPSDTLDIPD